MNLIDVFFLTLLLGFSVNHLVWAYLFRRYLTNTKVPGFSERDYPRAAVILSLRGPDPFLEATLRGLLAQDYPDYIVRIIVDSPEDPAWKAVRAVLKDADGVDIRADNLEHRIPTCSLKCSAIVQAVENLPGDRTVVAFLDADVTPHSESWLRDLLDPLSDPRIGASTGVQWFEPERGGIGSLVRVLWHAAAVVPTVLYKNPWGGSLGMRLEDIHRSGLIDSWKKSMVEDGEIKTALRRLGLKVFVSPRVIMVNREDCPLKFSAVYIRRMLLWSRLHERTFFLTPLHMLATSGPLIYALGAAVFAVATGKHLSAGAFAAGILLFLASIILSYSVVHAAIARCARNEEKIKASITFRRLMRLFLVYPLVQAIYSGAVLYSMLTRYIMWRGISYKVAGHCDVKLVEYHPFVDRSNRMESV